MPGKEKTVEPNLLPEDPDTLLALAEDIANVLGEKRAELGISKHTETVLRASIAAATYARSAYLAILAGANESPIALRFLAPAMKASDRTERQLRRRLTSLIAESEVMFNECA